MLCPVCLVFQQFVQNRCYFQLLLQFVHLFCNLSQVYPAVLLMYFISAAVILLASLALTVQVSLNRCNDYATLPTIYTYVYIYIYIKHILLNRLLFCLLICGGWMTSASEIKGRSLTAWSAIRKCYSESNRKGTSYVQRNEGRLTGSVTTCVGIAFCRVLLKGNLESTGRRRRRKQLLDDLTEKLWKRLWSCRKTDLWLLLLLLLRWCDDYMIMIIIIIIRYGCLLSHLFSPVLLSDQQWSPPLTLQASHCSTFRIVCDVPSVAVFCSESIECFPGTVSISFLKLLVTIPVAPVITGTTVHFRFHIRCISIHKLLYFNFFSASFCTTFLSAGIATSISACFIIIIIIIIITVMMMMMSCSYNEIRT